MTSQPDYSLADEPIVDEPLPDESAPTASLTPEPLPGEPLPAQPMPAEPRPAHFGDVAMLDDPAALDDSAALDDRAALDNEADPDETELDEDTDLGLRTAVMSAPGGLSQQWHDIQVMFVDDPSGSVRRAAQAADAAVAALSVTLRQRQAALAPDSTSNDPDSTEQLRCALREYRLFSERVAGLTDQLPHDGAMA